MARAFRKSDIYIDVELFKVNRGKCYTFSIPEFTSMRISLAF
jgi:hypothetical protein